MPASPLFRFENAALKHGAGAVLRRFPPLTGAPIRIQTARNLRDARGPVHAGSFLRQRRIAFNCSRREFSRIFAHELAHFIWLRLGNPARLAYERLLLAEFQSHSRGELGWSSQWRKAGLTAADTDGRSRRWREYCCESFCDTAAWLYSGVRRHPEFTLAGRFRTLRRSWFAKEVETKGLSI